MGKSMIGDLEEQPMGHDSGPNLYQLVPNRALLASLTDWSPEYALSEERINAAHQIPAQFRYILPYALYWGGWEGYLQPLDIVAKSSIEELLDLLRFYHFGLLPNPDFFQWHHQLRPDEIVSTPVLRQVQGLLDAIDSAKLILVNDEYKRIVQSAMIDRLREPVGHWTSIVVSAANNPPDQVLIKLQVSDSKRRVPLLTLSIQFLNCAQVRIESTNLHRYRTHPDKSVTVQRFNFKSSYEEFLLFTDKRAHLETLVQFIDVQYTDIVITPDF